jgi:transposase
MRKVIDGLVTFVQDQLKIDIYSDSIFLFAGNRKDRFKIVYFDGDGFVMLNKRFDSGKLKWPKNDKPFLKLTFQEYKWLLEGLNIDQPKAIKPSQKGCF